MLAAPDDDFSQYWGDLPFFEECQVSLDEPFEVLRHVGSAGEVDLFGEVVHCRAAFRCCVAFTVREELQEFQ
ncbi:hypothetical protein D3C74_427710 [compost metagenome]